MATLPKNGMQARADLSSNLYFAKTSITVDVSPLVVCCSLQCLSVARKDGRQDLSSDALAMQEYSGRILIDILADTDTVRPWLSGLVGTVTYPDKCFFSDMGVMLKHSKLSRVTMHSLIATVFVTNYHS